MPRYYLNQCWMIVAKTFLSLHMQRVVERERLKLRSGNATNTSIAIYMDLLQINDSLQIGSQDWARVYSLSELMQQQLIGSAIILFVKMCKIVNGKVNIHISL